MGKNKKKKLQNLTYNITVISNGFMVYEDKEYGDYDRDEDTRGKTYCETKEEVIAFLSNLIKESL